MNEQNFELVWTSSKSSPPCPADFSNEKSFLTLTTHPSERSTSIRVTGTLCTYTVYVSHPPSRIYSYMCVEGLKLASVSSSNNNSCFQRRLSNFCPITHPRHRVLNVSTNENKKIFGRPEVQSTLLKNGV